MNGTATQNTVASEKKPGLHEWVSGLGQAERKILFIRAAKEHKAKFTNAHSVADGWIAIYRSYGFGTLAPYVREFLSREYLVFCGEIHA